MKSFLQHLNEVSGIIPGLLAASMAANAPASDYKIQKGDTLSSIAQKNKTSVDQLLSMNPTIKDPNKISVGQSLVLSGEKPKAPEKSKQQNVPAWKPIISEFEGVRTDAYWDPTGKVWTIGKGSTTHPDGRPVKQGDRITKQQADEYMQHYVDTKVTPRLQKIPTWGKMNPNQQAALTSFAYNVGPGFYGREGFETITKALETEQGLANVPNSLSLYNKSDGKTLEGLKRRRKAEGALWSSPVN